MCRRSASRTSGALVAAALDERGRVFFIDELPAVAAHERLTAAPAPAVERALGTGDRDRAVKVLHEAAELRRRLADLGWQVAIRTVGWRFLYTAGHPI